ncbi:LOW QUALITY PROTEIN: dehydrogenase/reductase SDR family member 4-like [Anopheles albimanus]|uniref:LOW QUALITY PROTEIN: dehydrogenase/reductase SDR family member 4-like n=1 Tax=Anopheles albimanus TaxID=7167 RepID=UPI0016412BE9|nr:LOW QUALITY PROTEIN: dehydrogenase/reductase SDR family member 4-like [Anopheles albimanus]
MDRKLFGVAGVAAKRLIGKVAVVTASTEGIGFAIAERLGQEGAKVAVSSRSQQNVDRAVNDLQKAGLEVTGIKCHVANATDRQALFSCASKYGGIDILVSNAAVNPEVGGVMKCSESAWDKIFEVNVKSSYLLAKEVLPYIRERRGGSIVFISSVTGLVPLAEIGAYAVSKTAILGLTKAVSLELASENIRVNCIAPGIVDTRFAGILSNTEENKARTLSLIPMGRIAQPKEISGVCAFLVSDDASYITGETIVASGGILSRL